MAEGDAPLLVLAEAGEVRKGREIAADGMLEIFCSPEKHRLTVWADV